MTSKRIMFSDKNAVFYQLPSGKPDPELRRPIYGPDNRKRVVQHANKGPLCFYYACNMIRDRIGKNSEGFEQERKFEKQASMWRKSMSRIASENPRKSIDQIKECRDKSIKLIPICYGPSSQSRPIHELWRQFVRADLMKSRLFMINFNATDDLTLVRQCLYFYMSLKYGFECSKWHPKKDVSVLADELKKHGPLLLSGYFGNARPDGEKCEALSDLLSQSTEWSALKNPKIIEWENKVSSRDVGGSIAHAVVIVGVQSSAWKQWVYFADPNDASAPDKGRQIYRISYKELCRVVISRAGYPTTVGYNSSEVGYAVYKKQTPSLKRDTVTDRSERSKDVVNNAVVRKVVSWEEKIFSMTGIDALFDLDKSSWYYWRDPERKAFIKMIDRLLPAISFEQACSKYLKQIEKNRSLYDILLKHFCVKYGIVDSSSQDNQSPHFDEVLAAALIDQGYFELALQLGTENALKHLVPKDDATKLTAFLEAIPKNWESYRYGEISNYLLNHKFNDSMITFLNQIDRSRYSYYAERFLSERYVSSEKDCASGWLDHRELIKLYTEKDFESALQLVEKLPERREKKEEIRRSIMSLKARYDNAMQNINWKMSALGANTLGRKAMPCHLY